MDPHKIELHPEAIAEAREASKWYSERSAVANDAPGPMTAVDKCARNLLAAEVRRYLSGKTSAFEFDEAIFEIESSDPTVAHIVSCLWLHYDDCKDHQVMLSKLEWDYFQRLLLVLESDCNIVTENQWTHWRFSQLLALGALASFAFCAWQFGVDWKLFVVVVLLGVVSIGISVCRRLSEPPMDNAAMALIPFSSFAELRATYKRAGAFRKAKFREELAERRLRSPLMDAITWIPAGISWLMFSPVALCFQVLPRRQADSRVVAPTRVTDSDKSLSKKGLVR